jgi:hypothetical protein
MLFFDKPPPAIIIPAAKELIKPDRKLIMPAISFISSGRFSGVVTPPSNDFRTSVIDTANLTTYTFAGVDIGAADPTRRVIVGVRGGVNVVTDTLSSATIAGVGATIHVQATSSINCMAFFSAAVSAGTTATITCTFNTGFFNCGIGVWRLINAVNSAPNFTATDITVSALVLSVSIDIPSNGSLFAIAGGSTARTYTWSGATERYDQTTESPENMSGASETGLGTQTGRTVSATLTAGVAGTMVAMSWN